VREIGSDAVAIDAIGKQRTDRIDVVGIDARERGEQPVQIDHGLEVVGFGCLDQTVERGTGVRAGDSVTEEPIFPSDHKRSDLVLGQVVVDRDLAILEEHGEFRPLAREITECFAGQRLWCNRNERRIELVFQFGDQWRRVDVALLVACRRIEVLPTAFEDEQLLDEVEADLRFAGTGTGLRL